MRQLGYRHTWRSYLTSSRATANLSIRTSFRAPCCGRPLELQLSLFGGQFCNRGRAVPGDGGILRRCMSRSLYNPRTHSEWPRSTVMEIIHGPMSGSVISLTWKLAAANLAIARYKSCAMLVTLAENDLMLAYRANQVSHFRVVRTWTKREPSLLQMEAPQRSIG